MNWLVSPGGFDMGVLSDFCIIRCKLCNFCIVYCAGKATGPICDD
jgi:hypothetical protein